MPRSSPRPPLVPARSLAAGTSGVKRRGERAGKRDQRPPYHPSMGHPLILATPMPSRPEPPRVVWMCGAWGVESYPNSREGAPPPPSISRWWAVRPFTWVGWARGRGVFCCVCLGYAVPHPSPQSPRPPPASCSSWFPDIRVEGRPEIWCRLTQVGRGPEPWERREEGVKTLFLKSVPS